MSDETGTQNQVLEGVAAGECLVPTIAGDERVLPFNDQASSKLFVFGIPKFRTCQH